MALTMMLSVAVAGAALNTSDVQEILDFDSWMNIFDKKYADTAECVSSWIELKSRNTWRCMTYAHHARQTAFCCPTDEKHKIISIVLQWRVQTNWRHGLHLVAKQLS